MDHDMKVMFKAIREHREWGQLFVGRPRHDIHRSVDGCLVDGITKHEGGKEPVDPVDEEVVVHLVPHVLKS